MYDEMRIISIVTSLVLQKFINISKKESDHSSMRISELIEKYSVRSNMIFSVACLESFGASSFSGAIKPTKKFGLVGTVGIHDIEIAYKDRMYDSN